MMFVIIPIAPLTPSVYIKNDKYVLYVCLSKYTFDR